MSANMFRRALLCRFSLCQTFSQGSDNTGVWGECAICGKRTGFVSRASLRAYADQEVDAEIARRAAAVSKANMHFSGEPTSDGDTAAEYMRAWYEANRETDRQRTGKPWELGTADNFILGLMNEARRIEDECTRQTKRVQP
jgi:hypothetical protein